MAKYQILFSGKWVKAPKAREVKNGFLEYEIRDKEGHLVGLAKPGTWKKITNP